MIFCSKPLKHAFKATDFCGKCTSSLISDLQPMAYGLNKSNFLVKP